MLQRSSLEELHDDERPVVVSLDLVDGADVGMVQRGGGPRFPPKTLDRAADPGPVLRAGTSGRQSGPIRGPRPCRPRPCRRRRAFPGCGNGRRPRPSRKTAVSWRSSLCSRTATCAAISIAGLSRKRSAFCSRVSKRPRFSLQRVRRPRMLPQKGVALFRRQLQSCVQQLIESLPLFRVHRLSRRRVRDKARTWRCSSRASPWRARL